MPGFLPAARLRRTPPRPRPFTVPKRTFLTVHGGQLHLVNSTIAATTLATIDNWLFVFIVPNQIRHETATNNQKSNYWISASFVLVAGVAGDGGVIKLTTATNHGLLDDDLVEIAGVIGSGDVAKANGLWKVDFVDATSFKLVGEGNGFSSGSYAAFGYIEKHADAIARRQAVVDGGFSNPSAAPIRVPADTSGVSRGIGQANDHYFRYARDYFGFDVGQYVSGSAVTTPYEELNRGRLSGYPMGPLPRTSKYANGWEIISSDNSGGKLRLTVNKTPPTAWSSTPPSVILLGHSNIKYVSDIAAELGGNGLGLSGVDQAQVFTVTSVSTANRTLTLDADYWQTPGTGGSLIIKGGIDSAADNTTGNTRITSTVAHGLAIGDFVYIDKDHSNADLRTHTWRVLAVTEMTFDIDAPPKTGSDGAWYGTCTPMREDRFDLPDLSRDDVAAIHLSDWARLVEQSLTRHGARHLGWVDENAAQYKLSAVDLNPLFQTIDGTTERMLLRLARQRRIVRKFDRRMVANISWNPTKDAMSPVQRQLLRDSLDGMANEGACQVFLRSYYQMIGPDGFLENLEWLLARGFLYHYIPQAMSAAPTPVTIRTNGGGETENGSSNVNNTGRVVFSFASDGGMYPNLVQSDDQHNFAGQVFGVYGHSDTSRNGVHRHRACTDGDPYHSESETAWAGSVGQGGKKVHDLFGRIMKTVSLTQGASSHWRVRTEFPHLIWEYGGTNANNPSEVYLYGYSGSGANIPDGTRFSVYPVTLAVGSVSGTPGNPVVVTVTNHGLDDGDQVDISGVVATGSLAVSGRYTIDVTGTNTFALVGTIHSTGSYSSGGTVYVATRFDLATSGTQPNGTPGTYVYTTSPDVRDGIAFDIHADARYGAGLAMMVWRPGRLILVDESSILNTRDWKNWIQGTTPDGPYTVTNFDGIATGGSTTTLVNSGATFTDAVLGEPLLMTGGPNTTRVARIVARTATELTVSPALPFAVASGNSYVIGKAIATDATKVLELKRSFNGGARRIVVWPQKCAAVATGF